MFVTIFAFIILFILLCNTQENFPKALTEKTPYSHVSAYELPYLKKCKNNKCLNSRCIFRTMKECQNKCKTGCRMCNEYNTYMCDLQ